MIMDTLCELVAVLLLVILAAATVVYVMTSRMSKRQQLAVSLRGQVLIVPDLAAFFPSWPAGQVNPNYEQLRGHIDALIDE